MEETIATTETQPFLSEDWFVPRDNQGESARQSG